MLTKWLWTFYLLGKLPELILGMKQFICRQKRKEPKIIQIRRKLKEIILITVFHTGVQWQ